MLTEPCRDLSPYKQTTCWIPFMPKVRNEVMRGVDVRKEDWKEPITGQPKSKRRFVSKGNLEPSVYLTCTIFGVGEEEKWSPSNVLTSKQKAPFRLSAHILKSTFCWLLVEKQSCSCHLPPPTTTTKKKSASAALQLPLQSWHGVILST